MRRSRNKNGFVLVIVLWVLAILTVLSIGFARRALLDCRAAAFTLDHAKALSLARAAVERGIVELRNKDMQDLFHQQAGRTSCSQQWAMPGDLSDQKAFTSLEGSEVQDELCRYEIRDEDRMINLNTATEEVLLQVKALTVSVRRAIAVRRESTTDPDRRTFQRIEELRSIEGVTDKDWYGDGQTPGLRDLLTVWGDGRVNINTAPPEVLRCIPSLDGLAVDAIVRYRKGPDGVLYTADDGEFLTLDELTSKAGVHVPSAALAQYCKVDSQFFTITGTATRRQGKVRAACAATVIVSSPSAVTLAWTEESL